MSLLALVSFSTGNRYFEIVKNLDIFAELYKETNTFYVDEVNPSKLMNVGIEEMLATLDPYTVYISEDRIEDFKTQTMGEYGGVGAETIRLDDRVFISNLTEGSVAYRKGLKVGDEIIAVDGREIAGLTHEEVMAMVKGELKTDLNLTTKRLGTDELLEFNLEREKVVIPNVPYYGIVDSNVGYIKFTEFSNNGSLNIRKAIESLKKEGADKIVLDLRSNPGGLLIEAVNISNFFIPRGQEVVFTRGKVKENNNVFKTLNPPLDEEIPVGILINNNSASASEIVAGALQDYDRAVIIGQKSFGKGLVQSTRPLSYNAQLKVTIAKYYIPSGRCVQALDYAKRNPDGSVGKVPDSLKQEFTTKNGRIVYDGGGIDPDVEVVKEDMPKIALKLVREGYIFKYANLYASQHDTIPDARSFDLSDQEYNEFTTWLTGQNIEFKHEVEDLLDNIRSDAQEEQKLADVNGLLRQIEDNIHAPITDYLNKYQRLISNILEAEIAKRYYLDKGAIEAGLGDDKVLEQAIAVLNDSDRYTSILQ